MMTEFSETEYDLKISLFEYEIMECTTIEETNKKLKEIKEYINRFKLLHFRWKLEDDYKMLKNKINNKIKDLEYVTNKDFV